MRDVLIVGGGPAGLTAALYAARAGLDALLVERMFAGGQASTTDHLENYPGFPEGIGGPELMSLFEQQAKAMGAEILYDSVDSLDLMGDVKRAHLTGGWVEARSVILCMGAVRRTLNVPGEAECAGRGVSWCATCDGAIYRKRDVAVVGGGDTAVEEALYLARIARHVTLIHRRDALRASGKSAEAVRAHEKIDILYNSSIERIEKSETGIILVLNGERRLSVAALFEAVGTRPETALLQGMGITDLDGWVLASEDARTAISRVYAAGDLRKKPLRQIVTAAADGAVAAMAALHDLTGR